MAETPNVDGWDAKRIFSVVAVLLLVLALAGGAALVGAPDQRAADDPVAYVRSFYEESDVAGLLGALAPGSIAEEQLPQAEQDLGRILQPGVEASETGRHEFAGSTYTEVRTGDGLTWCVEPDGTVYVRCRIGQAPVTVDPGDVPVEATLAQVDVFPDHVELVVGLQTTGDASVTFSEDIRIEPNENDEIQLTQTAASAGGPLGPVQLADYELTSGATLFLVWRGTHDAVTGQELTVRWDDQALDVEVGEVEPLS